MVMDNIDSDYDDLIKALTFKGVSPDQYKIDLSGENIGGDDQYILRKTEAGWSVCYEERGKKKREAVFERFLDAGNYLFWEISNTKSFIAIANEA